MASSQQLVDWRRGLTRVVDAVEPFGSSPEAPLASIAFLESFGTSLMPRTSMHQGVVTGLSLIGARSGSHVVERTAIRLAGEAAPAPLRMAARLGVGVAGGVGSRLARRSGTTPADRSTKMASVDALGSLVSAAAVGGTVFDVTNLLKERYPARSALRAAMMGAGAAVAVSVVARRRLATRRREIQRWPVEQVAAQAKSTGIGVGVAVVGAGLARAFGGSRRLVGSYLGPGVTKAPVAAAATSALWAGGAIGLYTAGVGKIARANEKIDPGYSTPPTTELASGSPQSVTSFEDLGQQGRRYVSDKVPIEQIRDVMGDGTVLEPIRTFIGINSGALYPSVRAELALQELERTGAFDREYLLLISPTGTGWVDHTMIEAAEMLTRGDIATCCIQYGRSPSFLAAQHVALGRSQFRLLLWGVKQRLAGVPAGERPKVLVFGESLGAWTSSDVVMHQGIEGFDHYGIDKALWVGLPALAKWSRNGMDKGASDLVPEGSVGVFDRPEEFAALSVEERQSLRATILSHDNDPITHMSAELIVQEPDWLAKGVERGRGVPERMQYRPIMTFWHTLADAMNAMVTTPGEFGSFGHDYRGDMAYFVQAAYDLPVPTEEQSQRIDAALKANEVARSNKIKMVADADAEAPPTTD